MYDIGALHEEMIFNTYEYVHKSVQILCCGEDTAQDYTRTRDQRQIHEVTIFDNRAGSLNFNLVTTVLLYFTSYCVHVSHIMYTSQLS